MPGSTPFKTCSFSLNPENSNYMDEQAVEVLALSARTALKSFPRALQAVGRLLPTELLDDPEMNSVTREACDAAAAVGHLLEVGSPLVHPDTRGAVAVYEAAAACGNPSAQFTTAALASVGVFGIKADPLRAALLLNFAAIGNDEFATIAQAYRLFHGISSTKNCDAAAQLYSAAASAALAQCQAWGAAPAVLRHRLSVEQLGGVAGLNEIEGPSVAISELLAQAEELNEGANLANTETPASMQHVWQGISEQINAALRSAYRISGGWELADSSSHSDIVNFFRNQATTAKDVSAHVALGQIYYYGLRGQPHDYNKAVDHFLAAAEEAGALDPEAELLNEQDMSPADRSLHDLRHSAMAMLGECYLSGRGVKRNVQVAMEYLQPTVLAKQPIALNAMAVLVLSGQADYGFTVATYPTKSKGGPTGEGSSMLTSDLDPLNPVHRRQVGIAFLESANQAGHVAASYNLALVHMAARNSFPHGLEPSPEHLSLEGGQRDEQPQSMPSKRVWQRSFKKAITYFASAAQNGYLPSLHALGNMHIHGVGTEVKCTAGVQLLRGVVHRGPAALLLDTAHQRLAVADVTVSRFNAWNRQSSEPEVESPEHDAPEPAVTSEAEDAGDLVSTGAGIWHHEAYFGKGIEALRGALLQYLRSAAMGFEIGQWNSAVILRRFGNAPFERYTDAAVAARSVKSSMTLLQLSAKQGNAEAHVALGDVLFHGAADLKPQPAAAAVHYRTAADMGSGRALFNLGTMHEYGLGLPVDWFLAKRYYDYAMSADADNWVPVTVALESVRLKTAVAAWMQVNQASCEFLRDSFYFLHPVTNWLGMTQVLQCNGVQEKSAAGEAAAASMPVENEEATSADPLQSASPISERSVRMSAAIDAANRRKQSQRGAVSTAAKVRTYFLKTLQSGLHHMGELKRDVKGFVVSTWSGLEQEDRLIVQIMALFGLIALLQHLRRLHNAMQ
jgi:TPR repeat protein